MKAMRGVMLVGLVAGALLSAVGCGPEETGFPGNIDCHACPEGTVCWHTHNEDSSISGGCYELPSDCPPPTTCECLDATEDPICVMQEGCETIDEVPFVYCLTTAG